MSSRASERACWKKNRKEELKEGNTRDMEDFIDEFTGEQFEMVTNFFNSMPKLRHIVEIENPKTKVKNTIVLEGLSDFLV